MDDPAITSILNAGTFMILPKTDTDNSRVLVHRSGAVDTDSWSFSDVIRTLNILLCLESQREETVICGMKYIFDFSNTSFAYFKQISASDVGYLTRGSNKTLIFRQNAIFVVNLPSIATTFAQLFMNLLSKKLRKRIHFLRDIEELKDHFDPSILPVEYGGPFTTADIVKDMKERFLDNREVLRQMEQHEIILDRTKSKSNIKPIGNSNQLEFD
jgi:hypothetical protein